MNRWVEGRVVRNIRWNKALFTLEVDAQIAPFKAGQFTKLALFDEQQQKKIHRAYSFVNAPERFPHEFLIVSVEGGLLSPKLEQCQVGDRIWLQENASGFLVMDEISDGRELWLLATGTGISPFLSILDTPEAWQRFEQIILVHGVRCEGDLAYTQRIAQWQRHYKERFCYQPVVSREQSAKALQGRIPALIQDGVLQTQVRREFSPSTSQVLLCGNPLMIKDSIPVLETFGLKKHRRRSPGHISLEKYW